VSISSIASLRVPQALPRTFACPCCGLSIAWVTGHPGGPNGFDQVPEAGPGVHLLTCAQCEVLLVRDGNDPDKPPLAMTREQEYQIVPIEIREQLEQVRRRVRAMKAMGWKP